MAILPDANSGRARGTKYVWLRREALMTPPARREQDPREHLMTARACADDGGRGGAYECPTRDEAAASLTGPCPG